MDIHGFTTLLVGERHHGKAQSQLTERDVRSQIYGRYSTGNVSPAPKAPRRPRDSHGRFVARSSG